MLNKVNPIRTTDFVYNKKKYKHELDNQCPQRKKSRLQIDKKLELARWVIQDFKPINLGISVGVVVREYPTNSGPADYIIFVNRKAVGVIEAKPDNTILTFVEDQTERYATSSLK
jgi:type I restriction enzyme, R subunit